MICYYFSNGHCSRGNSCKYVHDYDALLKSNPNQNQHQNRSNIDVSTAHTTDSKENTQTICKYFMHGKCNHGDACQYKHPNHQIEYNSNSGFKHTNAIKKYSMLQFCEEKSLNVCLKAKTRRIANEKSNKRCKPTTDVVDEQTKDILINKIDDKPKSNKPAKGNKIDDKSKENATDMDPDYISLSSTLSKTMESIPGDESIREKHTHLIDQKHRNVKHDQDQKKTESVVTIVGPDSAIANPIINNDNQDIVDSQGGNDDEEVVISYTIG